MWVPVGVVVLVLHLAVYFLYVHRTVAMMRELLDLVRSIRKELVFRRVEDTLGGKLDKPAEL